MKKLFFIILGLILIVSPAYGVSNLTITPSDPKVGDTITITGKANPNEEINCKIWFEINPSINPPKYKYFMNNVEIPNASNSFKIIAKNAERLYVSLKIGMWVTQGAKANKEGIAVISKSNIPPGIYDIRIRGTIKDPEKPVKLKIFASTKIKADENGNFKYSYKVNNIPEGTIVHLDIGGIKRDIVIKSSIPVPPPVDTEDETDKDNTTTEKRSTDKKEEDITSVSIEKDYSDTSHSGSTNKKNIEDSSSTSPEEDKLDTTYSSNRNTSNKENNYNTPINKKDSKKDNQNTPINNYNINNAKNTPRKSKKENIVYGTVIKNIGNAILIIPNGTRVSTDGEISIKEVNIPNTTLAYYISPRNAKFSKPLILEIPYNLSQDKRITVLYYDRQLGRWINIPYTCDNNTITVKISKSGYYTVKEEYIEIEDKSIIDKFYSIIDLFRIITTLLLNYLQNLFK
ncbi:hypothetical protein CFE53_01095 [Methanofervidicoccus sp. A16]|uniref:hypothetical protein n=1 Tax=Methanofervidicoccus sp. A16 TaxID=2607662 RepID=UPI00118AF905|nr:hypothetical protein [Methanofervidicoccus sp. A16]AXI24831.1 hypothetical protein CFE53_01095 [Methanofervidicoccus sp. A16]